jgi:hypothetical protein
MALAMQEQSTYNEAWGSSDDCQLPRLAGISWRSGKHLNGHRHFGSETPKFAQKRSCEFYWCPAGSNFAKQN